MKLDKTFSIISRFNQALLFLGLLGILGIGIWGVSEVYKERHKPRAGEIAVKVDKKESGSAKKILSFGSFHKVSGADIMVADISERHISGHDVYSNSKNTNVIFISTKENKAHLLFPHSNYLILSSGTVTIGGRYGNNEGDPAQGFIYQYVKADSNDDKIIDAEDHHSVGLAHADGTGAVEILNNFDSLLSSEALDAETLSVIYQKGEKVISARYSLKTFKLISTTTITDLLAVDTHG